MKNEVFCFQRFWTYFKYDLKQMWRNHARPAIFIGGMGLIVYVIWVLLGLLFSGGVWHGPGLAARITVFVVAFTVLELYQTRTYGYLTDQRKGSTWLMVPASTTEKFISMLLITLVVIPVLFLVVFFGIDAILALADPTVGDSIFITALGGFQTLLENLPITTNGIFITPTGGTLIFVTIVSVVTNFLYFLLCGICFKRYKILGGIATIFLFSIVLSIFTAFTLPAWSENLVMLEDTEAARMVINTFRWTMAISILLGILFGVGIFYRLKTIKH